MLGVLRFPSGEYKRVLSVVGEHATVAPEHVPAASGQRHHAGRRARLDKGVAVRVSVLMPHRSRSIACSRRARWIVPRCGACVTPGEETGVCEPSGTYENGTPFLGRSPPSSSIACERRRWRIANCVFRPGRTFPANDCWRAPVVCGTTQSSINKYVPDHEEIGLKSG